LVSISPSFVVYNLEITMEALKTIYPSLASETFSHGKKHYFFDIKKAINDTHFLLITSSEKFAEGQFHRRTIQLWEEDLGFFVEALTMILSQLAYGELSETEAKLELVKDPKGMKAIAGYDRPREKLQALGPTTLSNAELLAILLCTGTSELSVLDLCSQIMKSVKDEPAKLISRTTEDFCKFPGIGMAKASVIIAALELGRRAFSVTP
jgi:DNA repair protein RadC